MQIIEEKRKRRDRPRNRIGQNQRADIGRQRNHGKDPDDTKNTDPTERHQHRTNRIAASAHRTAENFNRIIGNEQRRNCFDNDLTDRKHARVIVEQTYYRAAAQHRKQTDTYRRDDRQSKADLDTAFDAVKFPCAEVLTDKRCDRHTECGNRHPEDRVDFAVNRPCGNRIGTEIVDRCLQNDIADIVHRRLQSCRKSDLHDLEQCQTVKSDLRQSESAVFLRHMGQEIQDTDTAEQLRKRRRPSGTGNTHLKYHDKQNIQNNVAQTAENQHDQRSS